MTTYAAFLRGINVGGNKKVPMQTLRAALEKATFQNVRTLLASGNVLLESSIAEPNRVRRMMEKVIVETFGFSSSVLIRTIAELQALAATDPFKKITVTKDTRLYVTFLPEKPKGKLKIPYESPEKNFLIIRATPTELCSVLTVTPGEGTPEAMTILEKEFGKNITTRNWKTIQKMLAAAAT
jgi:uncharacterized protein (DUF1697 family)